MTAGGSCGPVLLLLCLLLPGCAGARVRLVAEHLEHPVSLSKALYHEGKVVIPGKDRYVGHFAEGSSAWSILWTLVPFTPERDISEMLNRKVTELGGDAIVNLKVHATEDYFFALTSMVPVIPHAVYYSIEGDVVSLRGAGSR